MTDLIAPEAAVQVMAQEFRVDDRCQLFVTVPGARTRLRPGASNDRVEVTVSVSGCEHGEAQTVLDRLRLTTRQVKDTVRVQTDVHPQELDARWWAWVRQSQAKVHLDIHLPASADAEVRVPGGSIDALDRELEGGLPGGSLVAYTAPPASQSELLLQELTAARDTLYMTTERTEDAVEDADLVLREALGLAPGLLVLGLDLLRLRQSLLRQSA